MPSIVALELTAPCRFLQGFLSIAASNSSDSLGFNMAGRLIIDEAASGILSHHQEFTIALHNGGDGYVGKLDA